MLCLDHAASHLCIKNKHVKSHHGAALTKDLIYFADSLQDPVCADVTSLAKNVLRYHIEWERAVTKDFDIGLAQQQQQK